MTANVMHFLKVKEHIQNKRLTSLKTKGVKKRRLRRKFDNLTKEESTAKKQRAKREGTYQQGGHMQEGGFDGEEQRPKKKQSTTPICPLCGKKGHKTAKSKKCTHNPQHPQYAFRNQLPLPLPPPEIHSSGNNNDDTLLHAADVDALDSVPFDDELPGPCGSTPAIQNVRKTHK